MGGEKSSHAAVRPERVGSPPRGRGKEIEVADELVGVGITPAWAGKSSIFSAICDNCRDHPRVGGEKA